MNNLVTWTTIILSHGQVRLSKLFNMQIFSPVLLFDRPASDGEMVKESSFMQRSTKR